MEGYRLLSHIDGPGDLRELPLQDLQDLCREIRSYIIETVKRTGGHLAPSLGVVELTVALHRVFRSPRDKIVWDVGHQCYAHKILTGRREAFRHLRQMGGLSGFCKRTESAHDPFGAGHASTSISAALGIATARDLRGEDFKVVAVIGDGGLSGGLALEGLDKAGGSDRDLIVVLNDNRMSISPTVGGLSRHLTEIITHPLYERVKKDVWDLTGRLPKVTSAVRQAVRKIEESLKGLITPGLFFENLGFRYLGPLDGHDLKRLISVFERVRSMRGPVLVHVVTQKGKGLADAESNPRKYHGIPPIRAESGKSEPEPERFTYTKIFGETMVELAERFPRMVAITAAMCDGTGLAPFAERFPSRFFDVGIAEGHAVTFAGGLATQGLRPVVAIYSTFLQRAYDQLIHDIALQRLPVIFCLDRAGLVGEDGATHHGAFDLSYLSSVPGMVIAIPRNGKELRDILLTALEYDSGPFALRYPRAEVPDEDALAHEPEPVRLGSWERLREGPQGTIVATGTMVQAALEASEILGERGIRLGVVNARFLRPIDSNMLSHLLREPVLVAIEENAPRGGLGDLVAAGLASMKPDGPRARFLRLSLPDRFIEHGTRTELLRLVGLDASSIASSVERFMLGVERVETGTRRKPRRV